MTNFDDVGDFHEKFGLDNVTHRGAGERVFNPELMEFRIKFLHEELQEFEDATVTRNAEDMFDALLDLVYVAMGTAHLLGFPWQAGWDEVQRANMTKVRAQADGSNSRRLSSFDVVKPPGWTPPRIGEVLMRYAKCPQCQRDLSTIDVKEVIAGSTQRVDIHCVCGAYLGSRPV